MAAGFEPSCSQRLKVQRLEDKTNERSLCPVVKPLGFTNPFPHDLPEAPMCDLAKAFFVVRRGGGNSGWFRVSGVCFRSYGVWSLYVVRDVVISLSLVVLGRI